MGAMVLLTQRTKIVNWAYIAVDVCMYTVNHKKRGSLFLTITLANLNQFL